ncbi:MAG: hypothetical protein CL477_09560 [Acidobacteria bacterium]|jgi:hypothetical protein|nr:hypothetical protein [Acidobacteriota bacterium]MDP7480949.1 hypothetical protein [Vicinamibacterales bacterium]HJN44410.1 hypothetical protein [Vicinamibacterales bacterium]|tara:strand:+ start:5856 stop:6272 length:417 start_codon:yes stop_codon:yes gene_type:complete
MTRQQLSALAVVLGVLLLAGPAVAGQASMLNSSDAGDFMGTWAISFESPRGGTFEQTLTVRDEGGKVAARLEGGRGGGNDITDIAKDGDDLVLTFERAGRGGNPSESVMTLTLDGAMINAAMSVRGGQFSLNGTGKKQ